MCEPLSRVSRNGLTGNKQESRAKPRMRKV
nr:MAG TPA: hypothetical protein [Caudoviricetes sp.]